MNSNAKNSRLYEKLKEDILSGSCQPGFRFPAEIPYAKELGVSRNTLRTALKWLEEENLIVRGRGKGTFVNPGCGYEKRRRYMLLLDAAPPAPYTEHIIPQIMLGIEQALHDRDIELEHCSYEHLDSMEHNEIMEMIRRRRISGILWKSSAFLGNEKVFLALKSLPVPVVLLYCQPEDYRVTGWAAIPQNTRNAWCEALRYLQGCGHTRIGIVNTDVPGLIRHEFNPEEYARILCSMGLDPDPRLIVTAQLTDRSVEENLSRLFRMQEPPTALLCYSDYWAPAVYRALRKLHLKIPDDIAVMGYCGTPNSAYMNPPLSTVAVGYREIGSNGIRILDEADQWFCPGAPEHSLPPFSPAPYRIIERQSTNRRQMDDKILK